MFTKDAALAFVRGTDPRPLLVLRECHQCSGTDFALLRRAVSNDRTMLLTHWFHCIKLPDSVRSPAHPLHALFADEHPPHLFFATGDGKEIVALPGDLSQSQVWRTMTGILRKSYRGNAARAVKQLLDVLNRFDVIDAKEAMLRRRLDTAVEAGGPRSARFKRLRTQFAVLQEKRKALVDRERELRDLKIRP